MSTEGPRRDRVGELFRALLGLTFVVAWISLGVQLDVLVGSRGLLPAADFAHALANQAVPFWDAPGLFRWTATDGALHAGIYAGIACSLFGLLGILPRLAFAASTFLYLSYAIVARNFLSFQWDNLLLECGALATLLPARGRSRWVWFLLKLTLFKLYFESGIAKYQSYLGDWKDGSAMAYYYETAPIPTWLAWYAHQFPAWWHALESRATLVFEIGVPFLIFGPRPTRLVALGVFTAFQVFNILTANYGFFSYLALILGVVLLDERDVALGGKWMRSVFARLRMTRAIRRLRAALRVTRAPTQRPIHWLKARFRTSETETALFLARLSVAAIVLVIDVGASIDGGLGAFWSDGPRSGLLASIDGAVEPLRIVNTYHLFGHITRDRTEPIFETFDGATWTTHDLHYKPGDPNRAPPFVAPHQPRVDFLLWFYGLEYERGTPLYVKVLAERMCADPSAVESLFVDALPRSPAAVRIAFYTYHFTTSAERRQTSAWWTREELEAKRTLDCEAVHRGTS